MDFVTGKRIVDKCHYKGITLRLTHDGKCVHWRGPVGAMSRSLLWAFETDVQAVTSYLRWLEDCKGPQTPLSQVVGSTDNCHQG